jgi:fermentation-respiration switch protein FrsA (DUF1100 family)
MKKFLAVSVAFYCALFAVFWLARLTLIYPLDPSYVPLKGTGLTDVVEHQLETPDGETLIVWVAEPQASKPLILYFPGNAGNLGHRAQRFRRLQARGFGFVAMAYRGSGGSGGSPNERHISADAIQIRESLLHFLDFDPQDIVVYYGESLGTGVAAKLAATHAPDGLILEAPFTSLVNVAAAQLPIFPVKLVLDEVWDSTEYLKTVSAPLLIIHGTDDTIVPYDMGAALFAAASSDQKQMITVKGGSHFNLWTADTQRQLFRFLNGF